MIYQGWAIGLFVAAAISWFLPQWNGIFFEPSNVTDGEGRIVAAILFVGGLLLWFLTPTHSNKD